MIQRIRQHLETAALLVLFCTAVCCAQAVPQIRIGIEILGSEHPEMVAGKNVAVLTGQASYDQSLRHTVDRLARAATITAIFTADPWPRRLIRQASATSEIDALTQAPVHLIRDPLQRPHPALLNGANVLVIDIQDIGIRFFSGVTLLAQFLELAKQAGVPVIVLDRPNPMGASTISGPVLDVQYRSRFGVYPIPLVYGLTIGELALYFNKVFGLNADLTVIGMENYRRSMTFRETGLHWALPSEHLPDPDAPLYYATTGFLGELGIFSTGVGTTRPFHYILAPWIDPDALISRLLSKRLAGVSFLPVEARPHYGLFAQKRVPGIEIVVTDTAVYDPVMTGVLLLQSLRSLYPDKIPLANRAAAEGLDTLLGGPAVREAIDAEKDADEIRRLIQATLTEYRARRREFLIYPEAMFR
ncbi:MAG TPA: DUF1343 domain-containing protein [Candidatus Ozemobacteraceae bacterium]|nr:DUF1343 domain-containing protein [Candidatus Ozemobacteraceae bacterium]